MVFHSGIKIPPPKDLVKGKVLVKGLVTWGSKRGASCFLRRIFRVRKFRISGQMQKRWFTFESPLLINQNKFYALPSNQKSPFD